MTRMLRMLMLTGMLALVSAHWVTGQEEKKEEKQKPGWSNNADLGLVLTAGNSKNSNFTFDDKLVHQWNESSLNMKFGGLRTKTTDDRFAVLGSGPGEIEVIEDTTTELDSERYYANGDFHRDINDRFFWVVGAGWLRDLDAGIENRTEVYGGVGNTWWNRDDLKFKTAYTFGYANQEDEIQDPLGSDTSPGIRFSSNYMKKFGANATYDNDLVFFFNLDEAEDYRFTWLNSVTSDFSKVFGLRVSLQLLYNNIPALEEIDLYDIDPAEGDASLIGTTLVRKKKLDTVFKVTFVIKI